MTTGMETKAANHSPAQIDSVGDAWLLDDFKIGDFFFASPAQQFLGSAKDGVISAYEPVDGMVIASLFEQASQRGVDSPVMFGLVPFDA